eukprot:TRINITY_DN2386_c0_g2_i3.p1 TRINITY_DN2386_c0_g2~~TRINITY_DN2386_c0_g2_i3.p1  ORF type:complete len:160 (-),score=12.09 TRINITY_DN2386_c0_g2_i3:45-524(-)
MLFRLSKVDCILEASDTVGGLYLGNYASATDYDILTTLNIKAVYSVISDITVSYKGLMSEIDHVIVDIHDHPAADLKKHFADAIEFIEKHRSAGSNVLVHCLAGVSRSATIVLAYIMKTMNLPYEKAFEHVSSRRPVIGPNAGFVRQLREFESSLQSIS